MKKKLTIQQIFDSPYSNAGLFNYLHTYFGRTALEQEIAYYVDNKHRVCSSHVDDFLDENNKLSDVETLANVIALKYQKKWDDIYDALITKYEILFNKFGTRETEETHTGGHSNVLSFDNRKDVDTYNDYDENSSIDYGDGINVERKFGERKEKQTYNSYDEESGSKVEKDTPSSDYKRIEKSGFAGDNDSTFANQNQVETTQTGTMSHETEYLNHRQTKKSLDDGDVHTIETYTDIDKTTGILTGHKGITGSKEQEKQGSETEKFEYQDEKMKRIETLKMNDGVDITAQVLIEKEIELRQFEFYQMMFHDINKVLCLAIYY